MLALIFIGHFRVFSWLPDKILSSMGMSPDNIDSMSSLTGGGAGIIVIVALLFLLIRRFATERIREISSPGDYFAVILILAILITGDAMRFISHFDLAQTREYFWGLATFSFVSLPDNQWFIVHYLLAQVLIIYIPFSKILHLGGIIFSEALIQKR
jgi:nitrate reductase gamma subunit